MGICFADINKPACITFKFTKEWLNYIWNISCNCSSAFHQPPLAHLILRLLLSVNSDLLWNKEMRQVYTKHRGGGGVQYFMCHPNLICFSSFCLLPLNHFTVTTSLGKSDTHFYMEKWVYDLQKKNNLHFGKRKIWVRDLKHTQL